MTQTEDEGGDTWTKLRKLMRPRKGRMIGGVCAAFGQATPVPAWMWRAGFCIVLLAYGAGGIAYIILMICIPNEPVNSA